VIPVNHVKQVVGFRAHLDLGHSLQQRLRQTDTLARVEPAVLLHVDGAVEPVGLLIRRRAEAVLPEHERDEVTDFPVVPREEALPGTVAGAEGGIEHPSFPASSRADAAAAAAAAGAEAEAR